MQPHHPTAPLGDVRQSEVAFVEREFGGMGLRCLYDGRVSVAFTEAVRQCKRFRGHERVRRGNWLTFLETQVIYPLLLIARRRWSEAALVYLYEPG